MNTLPNTTTFLTIQDTAKMLKVSTKTLRRWEAKEILVPVRTAGSHRRYTAAQVREYKDSLKIKKTKPQLTGPVLVEEAVIEKQTPVIASQAATSPVIFTASAKEVDPFEFVSPIQAQTNNIRTESVVLSKPKQKKLSAKILASSVFLAGLIVMATAVLSATGFSKPGASALNGNEAQVLASKDTLQTLNLNINIPAEFRSTLSVGEAFTANSTATVAGQLAVTSGDITTNGVTLSLDAPLTQLTGNLAIGGTSITSAADLTINPTGGGTRIGTATPTSVDLAGSDLFVSGDIETAGVAYITTLSINGDEFTDLTGSGLQVSSGTLATTLGTSVTGDEIEDDSIKEVDLNISNAPTSGQTLTYNSSTGGFTWASVASLFTDGGAVTYLTDTTDNFSVGTTSSLATIAAVGGSDQIQLLARANSTQTNNIFEVQNSAGTSRFSVDNTGNTVAAGSSTVGTLIINSDTFTDLTGNGLQVSGNTLTLSLPTATDALSSTTSTGSGLEVLSTGLTLLQGCSTGQVLKWNEANDSWECGNDTGGSAAIVNVYTDGTPVGASVDTINFGTDFTVTASPTNQANVSVADDALNFTELSDSLVLDAATTITAGSALSLTIGNNATLTTTGTGSIIATDVVCTDCIALGTETSGNFVSTITAGNGITGTASSEAATPTIAVDEAYGFTLTGNNAFTPSTTNDITFNLDSDSTIVLSGLQSASGTALCVEAVTNNLITCASGTSLTGSGTTGRIAKFTNTSVLGDSLISESGTTIGLNTATAISGTSVTSVDFGAATLTFNGAGNVVTTTTNALTLDSGTTGTVNLGTGNNAKTINIGTGTAGNTVNIANNNSTADTIALGSALDTLTIAGTTGITGATTINGSGSAATNIGTGTSTGTVTIGRATNTDLALNDAQWSITGAGAASFADLTASGTITFSSIGTGYVKAASGVISTSATVATSDLSGTLFTNSSDSNAGTNTVLQGDTVAINGGTNGVDTSLTNDTYTINLDTTEVGSTTFGSGSALTWTFDASAGTDTTIAFGNDVQTFTTASAVFSGDLAVNGADITTSGVTATIFNSNATSVTIGSAATTLSLGAATGTATIANATVNLSNGVLQTNGVQRLSNAGALGNITGFTQTSGTFAATLSTTNAATFSSSTTNSDSIALLPQSGTATNSFTGTITTADLTANRTYTLPDATGDICLSTGNCAGSGGGIVGSGSNNTVAKFTGTGTIGDSSITDDATTVTITANKNFALADGTGVLTQTYSPSGATTGATATTITPKFGINAADQTLTGILVNPNTNSNADSGDVLYAINLEDITGSSATETALRIGTGYDAAVLFETGSNDVKLTVTAPTGATRSLNIPQLTADADICTTLGNCAGVGGTGTITGVTAGSGLTGGGASGSVTLDIGAGTGISVVADAIALDFSAALSGDHTLSADEAKFGQSGIIFEGSTANTIETYLAVTNPTSTDKTITLPDASGTVILSGHTFTGDVTATLGASGTTALTIASDSVALGTDTTGNYIATITGNTQVGVSGSGSESAGVTLSINSDSITTSELNATLTFSDGDLVDLSSINNSSATEGLRLPQSTSCTSGTAEGQICWDTDNDILVLGTGSGTANILSSASTLFSVAGDSGSDAVTAGQTVTVAGGTNGIDTTESGRTVTVNLDTTEIGSTTFGSGSALTWTFDASAGTDTTIAFGNDTQTFTTGTATFSGNETIQGTTGLILSGNGANISFSGTGTHTISNSNTDSALTLNSNGAGALTLDSTGTGTVNLGTSNNAKTVNIATGTAGNTVNIATDNSVADAINIGSALDTLTIAGTTGITGTTTINGSGSSNTNIGTGTSTGTVTIGRVTNTDLALNDANWNVSGAGAANFVSIGATTAGSGAFTTLSNTSGITSTRTFAANSGTTVNISDITFTTPADSSGTNVSQAINITPTIGNATSGTNTANIINIGAVSGDAQVSLNAINIGALTGTAATERAISVAAGWDTVLQVGNNSIITGSGILQSIALQGTYSQALTLSSTSNVLTGTIGQSTALAGTFTTLGSTGNTTIGDANTDTLTINAGTSGTGITFGDSSFATCGILTTVAGVLTCGTPTSGMNSFTAAGDTGSNQTISDSNTLTIAGGTNGIDTVGGATDTITLNLDTTEIGSTTFGSGSAITWVFDASAGTDTSIAFDNDIQTFTTASAVFTGDLAVNGADITTTGATATIFDTNATSVSMASVATTLNLAAGGALARAINIGTGTGVDTINIGTGTTGADVITLGNVAAATTFDFNSAATTADALDFTFNSLTTANGIDLNLNGLTTGTGLNIASTSTAVTGSSTGLLSYINWSPSSTTTATGDLVRINIGANGTTTGNIFNVTDSGSSLFSVSETGITANVPTAFNAAGDVTMAYDLQFTNQTASFIKALGPLTIDAGESFESNDLTLKTYNSGRVIADVSNSGGVLISSNPTGTISNGLLNISGAATGKALAIFNESGDQNILTASASGTTVANIARTGSIQIAASQGLDTLVAGSLGIGDTTATTVAIGTTAATTLNLGAGGALARAINIGTGTGVDTINIGTGGTGADVITIGSTNAGNVSVKSNAILNLTGGANSLIDLPNFDVATTGNVTVAAGVGIDTNAAGSLALGDTTATTVSLGSTAATTLNLGAGGALARAINIGTGTGIDTISIGTGGTGADVISIGSTNAGNVSVKSNAILNLTGGANSLIDLPNFDVATTGNVTVAAGVGIDTSAAGTLALGDTTATTVSLGSTAATTLNLGAGGALTRTINIGTGTGADSINIGTGATGVDVLTFGNTGVGTTFDFNSGATAADALDLTFNSITTANGVDLNLNGLTTGTGLNIASTSTVATGSSTGLLSYLNWNPGSATTITGDLMRINIGTNGSTSGNLFNITDTGSSLFSVSETQITSALPHQFTAAGDVAVAYDLQFTNQTSSFIKANAPLTIDTGETFESNNLTLKTYNAGNLIVDLGTTSGRMSVGANITPTALLDVRNTNTATFGKALAIFDQDESQDIIAASNSGTSRFRINSAGNTFVTLRNTATFGVCHVTNGAGLDELTDCAGSVGADYMEMYPVSQNANKGTIVATSNEYTTTTQGQKLSKLVPSTSSYQGNVVGIMSDPADAGDFNSTGYNVKPEDNPQPVALSGRVQVKIASTSDAINTGDFITTSSEAGRGMKATGAGVVIAKALEPWTPNSGQDTILVFVQNTWFDPIAQSNSASGSGDLAQITNQLSVLQSDFDTLVKTSLTATTSGILANFSDVKTSSLSVLGDTVLADTVINGKLNVGAMTFDNVEQSINAAGVLKIQSLALGNIEFQGGLVTIDTTGNVVVNSITSQKYKVAGASAGQATLPANTTEIIIASSMVTPDSLIFVTPKKALSYPMAVVEKTDGVGFKVAVSQSEAHDIDFDWFIVDKTN